MLKNQKYGVEIELTGISRENAAESIAQFFGTSVECAYDSYKTRSIKDNQGRTWKVMRDSSIFPEPNNDEYRVEIVSPILKYEDIEIIQEILRSLRSRGAKVNSSCGIHIHIDGAKHTPVSLKNVINFMCSRQDLVYEALDVKAGREYYCQKMCPELLKEIKSKRELDSGSIEKLWYSSANNGYYGEVDSHSRYNKTRYQCLNLHSYFYRGTVEFRLFNSTTHAGELKAYIQFCLAVSAWAIGSTDKIVFKNIADYTSEQKVTIMKNVLVNRLGMTGNEFKTARQHLTKRLIKKVRVA